MVYEETRINMHELGVWRIQMYLGSVIYAIVTYYYLYTGKSGKKDCV